MSSLPEESFLPRVSAFGERDDMITKLRGALTSIDPDNRLAGAAITQGDPGGQILQFARSKSAGLIVMGAAGAERPERPIGSVTAIVVARSDCPVLIVPAGRRVKSQRAGLFERIACAVDLAPSSISVMKQALALAWETHAHLSYVCVMTEAQPSASEVQRQILEAVPPEADAWCQIEVVVKAGVPATEIVKIAESSDVDLLVIGPPRQWTSTTQAVLAKSLCPVLVTHDARARFRTRPRPPCDHLRSHSALRARIRREARRRVHAITLPLQSREDSTASLRHGHCCRGHETCAAS